MGTRKPTAEDDGRVIADMSGLERQPLFFPRAERKPRGETQPAETPETPAEEWSRADRRALVTGALGATMLIGGIFIAAGALVIAFLLFLWR